MPKVYAVGVGPGDPELLTLKAVAIVKEVRVLAFPSHTRAFKVVENYVTPEKEVVWLDYPMAGTKQEKFLNGQKTAGVVLPYLGKEDVAFFTLGDPSLYSTFCYLLQGLKDLGFTGPVEIVPGINSFSLAAARALCTLAAEEERIEILPSLPDRFSFKTGTTYIFLKISGYLHRLREVIAGQEALGYYFSELGTQAETIRPLEHLPDQTGYFSLVIAKRGEEK